MAAHAETAAKYSGSAPGPVSRRTGAAASVPGPAAAATGASRDEAITPGRLQSGQPSPSRGASSGGEHACASALIYQTRYTAGRLKTTGFAVLFYRPPIRATHRGAFLTLART